MQATNEFLEPEEQEAQRKRFQKELEREAKPIEFDPDEAFQQQMEKQQRLAHEARAREKFARTSK